MFGGAVHALPHSPQWSGSFTASTSHPFIEMTSQSSRFALQVPTAHLPSLHAAIANGIAQGVHDAEAHP